MGKRARVELCVGALVAAAVGAYSYGVDDVVDRFLYVGVLVAASLAAWVGAQRARAGHRLVRRLIAAGLTLTALGDAVWEVLDWRGAATDVSVADPLWFASYAVLCVAVWTVLSGGDTARDRCSVVIDAVTVVTVSILLFWSISIEAIVTDEGLDPHVRLVWAAYPVADAVLLALVVRVLMSRGARAAIDAEFAVGVCLWLAADIGYLRFGEGGTAGVLMEAAWMVAPVLLARTAWRSSPAPSGEPVAAGPNGWVGQVLVAIVPLVVPPALVVLAHVRDEPAQPVLLVVGTATLTLLALVRTARLMRSEEQAHRELEVARDAALAASRAKSMFLATMSHEIRTPLTMVLGTAELLQDTQLDDVQRELVARMRRSGDLLSGLVDDILDFSRIEAGQVELAQSRFHLASVVEDLAQAYAPRAARAGIRFEHRVAPGVPDEVVGDRDRLLQVLSNLLDNAVKFTPEGSVRLEVRPGPSAGGAGTGANSEVELVVSDTGIGIREEDLDAVFDSFRQVDGSTTRRYGGSGLGLAISRQLVTSMGGELTVTSEPGAGSTFVARIPLGRVDGPTRRSSQPRLATTGADGAPGTP
ncbi:HAMP domain-containing sensor histidine kinase [Nocardioides sp. SYSU D00065]|uniref:sensor histidine kinase n=1 Tax=Nocardioides sp. SYSU D00065 TaxID=2817378 RepID=UPI001B3425EC|nr:ATP-binding protein [Nocardioides sp. SYSU D00065]